VDTDPAAGSYSRTALLRGLDIEDRVGVNPYKFGLQAGTDSHTSLSTSDAIAIQIAVFEIANETSGTYDVGAGDLIFTNQAAAAATAQGWLDNINNGTWTTEATGLIALVDTSGGPGQDFVVQVVPVPAAMWLFGSGILGLAAVARRRRATACRPFAPRAANAQVP
jgi:hypothetical protein